MTEKMRNIIMTTHKLQYFDWCQSSFKKESTISRQQCKFTCGIMLVHVQ